MSSLLYRFLNISFVCLFFIFFIGCGGDTEKEVGETSESIDENIDNSTNYIAAIKTNSNTARLVFTGDIMTHPLLVSAFTNEDVLYSLSNYLHGDLVFANLEYTVNTNKEPAPYPEFNGSIEYLAAFAKYFNTFSVANNHAYDQGPKSQVETMGFISEYNVLAIGGTTNGKYIAPVITNINGVDIFISAYTTLDNGLSVRNASRGGYTYYMNFYPSHKDLIAKVKTDLEHILPSTLRIISLHFGLEYTTYAEPETKKLAHALIESGVDIIIGHHPHVPRPVEIYNGTNNNGVIIYSLGNFVANHKSKYPYLDIGTIVTLDVNNKKELKFSYVPTHYAFFRDKQFRVVMNAIETDPNISLPELPDGLKYTTQDIARIKEGYKLIHSFYSVLLDEANLLAVR